MAWTMPAPPDKLINLLRRQSPMAPVGALPPPGAQPPSGPAMAFGPPPTPETVANNRQIEGGGPAARPNLTPPPAEPIGRRPSPSEQGGVQVSAAQPQTAQGSQPAPPSDDPSISPVQHPPDISSYLNPAMQRINDLMAKRAAVPGIDPNQVKPKWWERALAVALGATQLRNPENAGNVADMVVHRRLYGAERARNLALQPIDQQIAAEREAFPLYTAAGEASYRQAELGQNADRENRERYTAKSNAGYKSDWNELRGQREQDQKTAAQDKLDQSQKALQERQTNDTTMRAMQDRITSMREQALKDKENNPGGEKRGTPGQFSGVEVKKQQALSKAHSAFNKALQELGTRPTKSDTDEDRASQSAWDLQHQDAINDLTEGQQQAQDAYEQEIISLGGSAQHLDLASQGKARPGAAEKVNELGGRKVGDVGVVRGQRVKITNIYKNGKFDYEPVTGQ